MEENVLTCNRLSGTNYVDAGDILWETEGR